MTDIRVYDFEFNLLCIMTNIISSEWRILYNGVGTYEGHFRLSDEISDIIMKNQYIVLTQGDKQAICTGKILTDELIVCGRTPNWILTRRVRPPFKSREIFGESFTDAETILLYCLKKGFTEPCRIDDTGEEIADTIDTDRSVDNFIIPEAQGAQSLTSHFWRITANDLSKLTTDLCQKLNRGHKVIFDINNKCWRFEFINPRDSDIIISKETKTAHDISYTQELLGYAQKGWYSEYDSEAETEEQTKWYMTGTTDKKGIYAWDCVLEASGKSAADDELLKKQSTDMIEAKMRNLQFGEDYDLGDIVCVYVKFFDFEKEEKYMVSGVNIKITANQNYEEPILSKI